ncbi:MAG: ABC transporter substrate-binding protein [Ktedonobacterales bacterium]|nr:ABC transporter substrate-binding protein [Ktedonobacterales bacterium]
MRSFRPALLLMALVSSLFMAACGSSSTASVPAGCTPPTGVDTTKLSLVSAGKLTVATDASYPPQENKDPATSSIIGLEPDLVKEFAKRLCLTPNIQDAKFDSILTGITAATPGNQNYDMSLSAFTITSARLKQVDMIPYFTAGESLLVASGNPKNIKSKNDLCGLAVAVEAGTVEEAEIKLVEGSSTPPVLNGAGGACVKNPVKLQSLGTQDQVIQALQNGSVDATYQDSPVSGYYNKKAGGNFVEITTVSPAPEGIVVRKDNTPFESAIKAVLKAMQSDGTYDSILKTWGLSNGTCTLDSACATGAPTA